MRCERCKDELLVAFSCKGRGVCPSCNAKRAQVTAVHLVERVLPHVPYRQWTLSFPHRVRWVLLKEKGLLSEVLALFPVPWRRRCWEAGSSWKVTGRARAPRPRWSSRSHRRARFERG